MDDVTVLSPHRDDAVFSLYICLSRWRKSPLRITILNFFTQSAYAPYAPPNSCNSISSLRAREDRYAINAIDPRIRIKSAKLMDAPLRLNIAAARVCDPELRTYGDSHDLQTISMFMQANIARGLAIAPLALGNHVDHLLVHNAAVRSLPGKNLAFYEDLPYATWVTEEDLRSRIMRSEESTRVRLQGVVLRAPHATWRKREVGVHYRSQITPREAVDIADYSARYGGGERIWIPLYSKRWRLLVNGDA
jgi:hypothetical protein